MRELLLGLILTGLFASTSHAQTHARAYKVSLGIPTNTVLNWQPIPAQDYPPTPMDFVVVDVYDPGFVAWANDCADRHDIFARARLETGAMHEIWIMVSDVHPDAGVVHVSIHSDPTLTYSATYIAENGTFYFEDLCAGGCSP